MAENTFTDQEMPYSLDAEQTVLGAILIDSDVIAEFDLR